MEIDSEIVPDENIHILGEPLIEPDSGPSVEILIPFIVILFCLVLYLL